MLKGKNLRDEFYFAIGNCLTGLDAYTMEGRKQAADAAEAGGFVLIQFGVRVNIITPDEGNDLLACLKKKGLGSAIVFEKHGQMDQAADAIISLFTGS